MKLLITVGCPRSGKAQPLYSKIKTPGGWTQMGNIKIGDIVNTPDGKTAPVTDIFPQGLRPTYRITFEDERTTDCDENHLWKVYNKSWAYRHPRNGPNKKRSNIKVENPERILSLKEIEKQRKNSKASLYIPLLKTIDNTKKDLPLDPYILGLLLGDGSFRCPRSGGIHFSNIDYDILQNMNDKLIESYKLKKAGKTKCDYRITHGKNGITNHYAEIMRQFGLYNKYSHEKFIPEIYKEASVEQRLELLRGLMDTDGCADKVNVSNLEYKVERAGSTPYFGTSSHRLALDVQYLVRSLGGLCKITFKKAFYTHKGVKKQGRTCFRCSIRYNKPEELYKINRKKERVIRSKNITLRCKIKSIKYIGDSLCQCIVIDHPDHLYITDNFIVTHNSTWSKKMTKEKGYVIVNPDSIRLAIHGKKYDASYENKVWGTAKIMVKSLFIAGHETVILDATSISHKSRKTWVKIGKEMGFKIGYVVFEIPISVCIERAIKDDREDLIPIIKRMSNQYQDLDEEELKNVECRIYYL